MSNIDVLVEAGVIVNTDLPDAYREVIDGLDPELVAGIADVKRRLDEMGESAGRAKSETAANFIII